MIRPPALAEGVFDGPRLLAYGLVSLGLHVFILIAAALWPGFESGSEQFLGPVYTVDLVSAPGPPPPAEPAEPETAAEPASPPAPAKPKPKPAEKVKVPEPAELIPIGKSKDKEKPKLETITKMGAPKPSSKILPVDQEKELDKALERIESLVAQKRKAEEKAAAEKRRKSVEEEHLAKALARARERIKDRVYGRGTGGVEGGRKTTDAMAVYYSKVWQRIRSNWTLPEEWLDGELEAVVVLKVRPDGTISEFKFEKRSGHARFDQSVAWAIERSSPLPPLPPVAAGSSLEIGVRFRPED